MNPCPKGIVKARLNYANHILNSSLTPEKIGCTDVVMHEVNTKDRLRVREKLRHFAQWQRDEIAKQVKEMLDDNIIVPMTHSEWICNVALVKMKDHSTRFCVDYKPVNHRSLPDSYPLFRIDDCLSAMCGAEFFIFLDLPAGYWQTRMYPDSITETAFITPGCKTSANSLSGLRMNFDSYDRSKVLYLKCAMKSAAVESLPPR